MFEFKLEIITPERVFYSGMAEQIIVESVNGRLAVLAKHAPMIAAVKVGKIEIKKKGEMLIAFSTDGFMEVRPDETLVFAQKCEWPEEIDVKRAQADEEIAQEMLLKKQSLREYKESQLMLSRAMTRLRIINSQYKMDR